jgi:hypothetical protein
MIEANFDNKFDAASLEAKMAKFKFAKKEPTQAPPKNADWFKQIG